MTTNLTTIPTLDLAAWLAEAADRWDEECHDIDLIRDNLEARWARQRMERENKHA